MNRQSIFRLISWLSLILLIGLLVGCRSTSAPDQGEVSMAIQVSSPAFAEGATIPRRHTCDGENLSPQLQWSGIPGGTQSLALITDDPDAPMGTYVHWVLYDIPPELTGISEGVKGVGTDGKGSSGRSGYAGPCPPKGSTHRYYFKLYALDIRLNLAAGATKAQVEKAMQGHILAQGQLMGKYGR